MLILKECLTRLTSATWHFHLQVISNMRVLMTEDSNNAVSSSFLLDDDSRLYIIRLNDTTVYFWFSSLHYFPSCVTFTAQLKAIFILLYFFAADFLHHPSCSIPFSVDDLSKSMDQIDISDIEPPPLIRENSGFSFLLPRAWLIDGCSVHSLIHSLQ